MCNPYRGMTLVHWNIALCPISVWNLLIFLFYRTCAFWEQTSVDRQKLRQTFYSILDKKMTFLFLIAPLYPWISPLSCVPSLSLISSLMLSCCFFFFVSFIVGTSCCFWFRVSVLILFRSLIFFFALICFVSYALCFCFRSYLSVYSACSIVCFFPHLLFPLRACPFCLSRVCLSCE